MTSAELPRHYHVWEAQDYRTLVDGCVARLPDAEIARNVGRKLSTVKSHARYLVEPDPNDDRTGTAWRRLRALLETDPGYDWETVARRTHADEQRAYWDEDADAYLTRAWAAAAAAAGRSWWRRTGNSAPRMDQLENELGIHEFEIARRLCYRDLATSFAEVVDRFGASPDGALAARARLAAERESVTLHVLTVTDESGVVLHTSLHSNPDIAQKAKDDLTASFVQYPLAVWTIVPRAVGEKDLGRAGLSGSYLDDQPATEIPDLDAVDTDAPHGQ